MRVPTALVILASNLPVPLQAASLAPIPPAVVPGEGASCPHTRSYLANAGGIYRGVPPEPRKLDQLPPGTTYMAVYRHIGGCEVPLTMVEYRNPRRH